MERGLAKPGTPAVVPSKVGIISWLRSLFPDLPQNMKIQDLGDGIVYCRILNHFHSNPPLQKILYHPKNQYEYANNLKHVQNTLLQLAITIPFDVNRVAKRKFLENWSLINNFYRHFGEENNHVPDDRSVSSGNAGHHYPSKSYTPRNPQLNHSFSQEQGQRLSQNALRPLIQQSHSPHINRNMMNNIGQLAQSSLNMTSFLKENMNLYNNSPSKGKWSVGSQMFQNNQSAIIDRVKEILLKTSHDTEKIRQIKMLLGMPLEQEEVIKIEDDEVGQIIYPQLGEKIEERDRQNEEKQNPKEVPKDIPKQIAKQSCHKDQNKVSLSKISVGKRPFKI